MKLIGRGIKTNQVHSPVLTQAQVAGLTISPAREPFDGDATLFRLGIEAQRLGLAYEYDPYFSLSIARIDPLPHQLEAVYDFFLKLPRIRFLLSASAPLRDRQQGCTWPRGRATRSRGARVPAARCRLTGKTVRERHSPLSDSARRAVDPANAILNDAYGVLEEQCRQCACDRRFRPLVRLPALR